LQDWRERTPRFGDAVNDGIPPRTPENTKNSLAGREAEKRLKRAKKQEWPRKPAYQPSAYLLTEIVALRPDSRHMAPHNETGWDGRRMQVDSVKLRELAAWYREQAERTENTVIWDARLRTAEELDAEADRIEGKPVPIFLPGFW
jgi:hypothetical protein